MTARRAPVPDPNLIRRTDDTGTGVASQAIRPAMARGFRSPGRHTPSTSARNGTRAAATGRSPACRNGATRARPSSAHAALVETSLEKVSERVEVCFVRFRPNPYHDVRGRAPLSVPCRPENLPDPAFQPVALDYAPAVLWDDHAETTAVGLGRKAVHVQRTQPSTITTCEDCADFARTAETSISTPTISVQRGLRRSRSANGDPCDGASPEPSGRPSSSYAHGSRGLSTSSGGSDFCMSVASVILSVTCGTTRW